MEILVVGGFLGSGKTTWIERLIRICQKQKPGTIALIENEVGQFGVDNQLLMPLDIQIRRIFGGCVCCMSAGNLLNEIEKVRTAISPDVLIIELTGLAMPQNVREILGRLPDRIRYLCLIDSSRWEPLQLTVGRMVTEQALGADAVLITKTDMNPDTASVQEQICHSLAPKAVFNAAETDPFLLFLDLFQDKCQREEVSDEAFQKDCPPGYYSG